jgi:hypothetical protein
MWYGASKVVEAVAISPIRSVTADSAESNVKGSNDVTVWLLMRAAMGMFNNARWSAMKKASNFASSSRRIERRIWSRLKFACGSAPG